MSDTNPRFPAAVTLAANGASDPIELHEGRWALELYATTWDAGNAVTIQFAGDNVAARYTALPDPETAGETVSRTANGPPIIIEHGGGFVRISAPTIGSNDGLTLVAKYVGI